MTTRRWLHGTLLILLTAGLAACGSQSRANEASPEDDGAAAAEEVASAEGTEAAGTETAASERPTRRATAETTRAPESTEAPAEDPEADEASTTEAEPEPAPTATIASGTSMTATLDGELSTKTAKVGDTFTATLASPVVEGRQVIVPEGAILTGEITGVQKKSGDQKAALGLAFRTLTVDGEPYPITGSLTSITPKTEREMKDEGAKIGGGAAAGGLLGAIIGGDAKGAVIGAAAGAAAGTVVTLATREEHAVLPAGTALELQLDESLQVRM